MTQTNRPTLTSALQDGIDAARASSILSALERTSARKPVLYADRPSGFSRRLPWAWLLTAWGLAGALMWGYASWSGRTTAVDASPVAPVLPQASGSSTTTPLTTSNTRTSGSVVPTNGTGADVSSPGPRIETKAADGGAAGASATLVDLSASVAAKPTPSSVVAVPNKTAMVKASPSKTVAARAAPTTVTASARAAAAQPASRARPVASKPTEDDPDVVVVSALIGLERERGVDAAAPATQRPTIASLIRECNALRPREASACRQRICDGYWGKAQACPGAAVERKTAKR